MFLVLQLGFKVCIALQQSVGSLGHLQPPFGFLVDQRHISNTLATH